MMLHKVKEGAILLRDAQVKIVIRDRAESSMELLRIVTYKSAQTVAAAPMKRTTQSPWLSLASEQESRVRKL